MHHYTVFQLQRSLNARAVSLYSYKCTLKEQLQKVVHFLLVCSFSFELLRMRDIPHRLSKKLGPGRAIAFRWIIVEVLPPVPHPALRSLGTSSCIDEMVAG
jgi:hypothetical protein